MNDGLLAVIVTTITRLPSSGLADIQGPGHRLFTMPDTTQSTAGNSHRSWWVRLGCLGIAVVVVWLASFPALVVFRMWTASERIDHDGGPVPSWLPPEVEDLHLRGMRVSMEFSGRCPQAAIEAWATRRGILLKERRRGRVEVVDYGKVPLDWTSTFRHDESIRTYLEDAEEIIWERRARDGGGITLHYIPTLQVFHGNRALW